MNDIKIVTSEEMESIIEKRKPLGKFFMVDGEKFVGCDNETGDAWVEEFDRFKDLLNWLI